MESGPHCSAGSLGRRPQGREPGEADSTQLEGGWGGIVGKERRGGGGRWEEVNFLGRFTLEMQI